MMRVPDRPSRPKAISIPKVRRNVWARRSRPASARGLLGQPPLLGGNPCRSGAGAQQLRCATRPCGATRHDFPHPSRHGIGIEDAVADGAAIFAIRAQECSRRHERALASGCPLGKISHARPALDADLGEVPQSMRRDVEHRTQDARPLELKAPARAPFPVGAAVPLSVRASERRRDRPNRDG